MPDNWSHKKLIRIILYFTYRTCICTIPSDCTVPYHTVQYWIEYIVNWHLREIIWSCLISQHAWIFFIFIVQNENENENEQLEEIFHQTSNCIKTTFSNVHNKWKLEISYQIVPLQSAVSHRTYHYFRCFLRNMQKSKPTKSAFKNYFMLCLSTARTCVRDVQILYIKATLSSAVKCVFVSVCVSDNLGTRQRKIQKIVK